MESVPSSISFAELASYLNRAPTPGEEHSLELFGDFTREELEELADDAIDSIIEIAPDPMVHKIMALKILAKFVNWHNRYGQRVLDLEGPESTGYIEWMNDAGILKASGMLLSQVSLGTNDYISPEEHEIE